MYPTIRESQEEAIKKTEKGKIKILNKELTRDIVVPWDALAPATDLNGSKLPPTQKFLSFHPSQEDDRLVVIIFFFSQGTKKK